MGEPDKENPLLFVRAMPGIVSRKDFPPKTGQSPVAKHIPDLDRKVVRRNMKTAG